jgi:hypothetical protein
MKRFLQIPILMACAIVMMFSSCSSNDNDVSSTTSSETLKKILTQYVNNTVIITYHNLADASVELEKACETLQNSKTQANADSACKVWVKARKYWEQSEAFLYGPATNRGIDPHIDSWPLDKTNLDNLLENATIMANFDASYATSNLNGGLLGFHALEYVLFRDGGAHAISDISDNELKYAVGVSGDLKLQCIILEAAWAGTSNLDAEKQSILEKSEVTVDDNWGNQIINAGESGSKYKTQKDAILEIIQGEKGCRGIANEVGNTKIADPVNSGNVLDVESWYSWNSKTDFQDNIRGVLNSCAGGVSYGSYRNNDASILSYIKALDSEKATKLQKAINDAIGEDGTTGIGTIPYPFRNNLNSKSTKTAMEACNDLVDILDEVATLIQSQN